MNLRLALMPAVLVGFVPACVFFPEPTPVPVDTAAPVTAFEIEVEVPGWGSWSGTPSSATAVHLDGGGCVPSDVLRFVFEDEFPAVRAELVIGANGSTLDGTDTPWWGAVVVSNDSLMGHLLQDGVLTATSEGSALVIELAGDALCAADGSGCEPLAGPVTVRFRGPIAPMDDDLVPRPSSAWLDPGSTTGLCVEPDRP